MPSRGCSLREKVKKNLLEVSRIVKNRFRIALVCNFTLFSVVFLPYFLKTFFPKKVTNTVTNSDSKLLKDKPRSDNSKKEKDIESKKDDKKIREKNKKLDNEILQNNIIKPALNSDTLSPQLIKRNEIKKITHQTNVKQTSPVNETAQVL